MIQMTPRLLTKIIKGAKRRGRDTKKLEEAKARIAEKGRQLWTSRKCKNFREIEHLFDEHKHIRPWNG